LLKRVYLTQATLAYSNIARAEQANVEIAQAFEAATTRGFKLFFSFDYAGNGAWGKDEVKNLVNTYKVYGAYQTYNSKPLVSTFEGPGSANDWHEIKQATQCFFVPDWSSEVRRCCPPPSPCPWERYIEFNETKPGF
jgi:hypothetical protein